MPVYDYQCTKCGERFEIMCKLADRDANTACPACGARETAQVFGGFKVGISRSKLNPGVFERPRGGRAAHKPPARP